MTLDGASLTCRRSFNSSAKVKFTLASSTKVGEHAHSCFYVESQFGTRVDFDATTPENRSSWMQSVRNNRAWVATVELETWEDLGGGGGGGGNKHKSAQKSGNNEGKSGSVTAKFLAAGLPAHGSSFSDEEAWLRRGWNFISPTHVIKSAYVNGALQ